MEDENPTPPTLTLFCGLPGSGKTTLARRLETEGRGIRLCTDEWQERLGVDHGDERFHEHLQTGLYDLALTLLDHGQNVILEDGLWTRQERTAKLSDAHAHNARTEIHVFDLTEEQLWERLERRNANPRFGAVPISLEEFERICACFEKPDTQELSHFDQYEIHGVGETLPSAC